MAVDPVPYVVHGAKHSADVFRQAFHDSTGGAEGVSTATSFGVKATSTPSGQVRVFPGGAIVLNSYQGGAGQSYGIRNANESLVDIPASDSTGAKSWYVIARISDPQFAGPVPADPEVGPYLFLECVSQSATITDPHLKLASVVVPASTATITNAMITNLRKLARPRRETFMLGRPLTAMDTDRNLSWSEEDGGEFFPGGSGSFNSFDLEVPDWAGAVLFDAAWMSVKYASGNNPHGRYWLEFGDEYKPHTWPNNRQYEFGTQKFAFDSPGSSNNNMRTDWRLMSTSNMPKKLRGKTVTFAFKAGRNDSGPASAVSMDSLSGLGMHITFVETALDPVTQEDAA